ncbi:MAG: WG repeat-containing protein [Elusimicrobiales bacterium]
MIFLFFSLPIFCQVFQSKAPPGFEEERKKVLADYKQTLFEIKSSTDCLERSSFVYSFIKKYGDDTIYSEKLRNFFIKRCIRNGKMGICCDDGRIVVEPVYDFITPFYNGYSLVRKDKMWGIIDVSGKIIGEMSADKQKIKDEVKDLRERFPLHRFVYTQAERLRYLILEDGELIKDMTGGGVGFFNRKGDMIIPKIYEDAKGFSDEGLCPVKLNGKWGFINNKNKTVIPFKYDDAGIFSEGLAAVELKGKWGVIDINGRMVVKNIYDLVMNFYEGIALVNKDGKYGYIDKRGVEIVPPIYEDAEIFADGIAKVKKNGKVGYVDRFGFECCFK